MTEEEPRWIDPSGGPEYDWDEGGERAQGEIAFVEEAMAEAKKKEAERGIAPAESTDAKE